jgi:simple sugar transport system ATP-binding protein
MTTEPFLHLRHVSKHYGGLKALDDVSLDVAAGEAHCLIGENGSGKSTLIKIISGVVRPDRGARIQIAGETFDRLDPSTSTARGIQVIFQDHALFPHLSVAENIAFGSKSMRRRLVSVRRQVHFAEDLLDRLSVQIDPTARVEDLPASSRQLVAIARALAAGGRFLIMDEPTASLTGREVEALFRIVDDLRRAGTSILFVSHRLAEVRTVAERVSVLRDGRLVATEPAAGLTDRTLARMMTGQEYASSLRPNHEGRTVRLAVEGLSRNGEYEDVSFHVHEGEVLGIVGALGAGRTELALTLFGMTKPDHGRMQLDGAAYLPASNRDALAAGVAYLPEDRLTLGLVLPQSIANNIVLSSLSAHSSRAGVLRRRALREMIDRLTTEFRVKVTNLTDPVSTLSGGNQQRVALARLVATRPKVLILDCPTVGVDIGAKHAIYQIVHALAGDGMAVILISDEENEVIEECHRIHTMCGGRITGMFRPSETSEAELRRHAHG